MNIDEQDFGVATGRAWFKQKKTGGGSPVFGL